MISNSKFKLLFKIGLFALFGLTACPIFAASAPTFADSLPAFKSDSALQDPFKQLEAGNAQGLGNGKSNGNGNNNNNAADTGNNKILKDKSRLDSLNNLAKIRLPGISLYLGVDFFDLSEKDRFVQAIDTRRTRDSLDILQPYESVHLAFPLGLQVSYPISSHLDILLKTHSYWYKQTALLGKKNSKTDAGEEWFVVQGNLGGGGIRYSLPHALLSVKGELGLYVQGLWYWNLGGTEMYSPRGSAKAKFDPSGSGYEIQLGFQQAISKPWALTGGLGFIHQEFSSTAQWNSLVESAPTATDPISWTLSGLSATFNLWYYFGFKTGH